MERGTGFGSPVSMDFATCLRNSDDGSVMIRKDIAVGVIALFFFGSCVTAQAVVA